MLSQGLWSRWLPASQASFAAFSLCAASVLWVRPRAARPRWQRGSALLAGGVAGGVAGAALLRAAAGSAAVPPAVDGWTVAATVGLAPVFEEILYRERLLAALRPATGRVGACLLSSALFAAPHLEGAAVLRSFAAGLALAGVALGLRSVAPCIGLHAGANLTAVVLDP